MSPASKGTAASKGVPIEERFAQAVRVYVRALQEAAAEVQQRQGEAVRGFWRALNERSADFGSGPERGYPYLVQEAYEGWQQAARTYLEAAQEAAENLQHRGEEAFRGYVAGLKDAWAAIDPAAIDSATVAAIAQAMAAAAARGGQSGQDGSFSE